MDYLKELKSGHHLIYTHGGLMCSLTYKLGVRSVLPNCSVISVELCPEAKEISKLNFVWNF